MIPPLPLNKAKCPAIVFRASYNLSWLLLVDFPACALFSLASYSFSSCSFSLGCTCSSFCLINLHLAFSFRWQFFPSSCAPPGFLCSSYIFPLEPEQYLSYNPSTTLFYNYSIPPYLWFHFLWFVTWDQPQSGS